MKRILSKFLIMCICLVLSCFIMPTFSKITLAEENVEQKHTLIGSNFNTHGNVVEKYNIQPINISAFTPFDLASGQRMPGSSFEFVVGEDNKFIHQYVYVDDVFVPEGDNSLFVWIYFDSIYLHNLTITLELENGSSIEWFLNVETLINLVKKTTDVSMLSLPFSWNQIELPFSLATKNGDVYNLGSLSKISKMIIDFTSEVQAEDPEADDTIIGGVAKGAYAKLRFYDIYISKSTSNEKYSVEKQNYRFFKFNFYTKEFINSLCVGDEILLLNQSQAISYAWNGQTDLKNSDSPNVVWSIMVKTPETKNQYIYPSFGDKLTFDKEGVYEIIYQCKDLTISNTTPIMTDGIVVNIREMKGVYFDQSSFDFEVGKTYVINVHTSSLFSSVTSLDFVSSSDDVIIQNNGNGTISVKVLKEGNYNIDATVVGKRIVSNVEKEYTDTLKIKASNKKEKNDKTMRIVLLSALGVGIVVILGFLIKKIVDNRKISVK